MSELKTCTLTKEEKYVFDDICSNLFRVCQHFHSIEEIRENVYFIEDRSYEETLGSDSYGYFYDNCIFIKASVVYEYTKFSHVLFHEEMHRLGIDDERETEQLAITLLIEAGMEGPARYSLWNNKKLTDEYKINNIGKLYNKFYNKFGQ
jgi:hypothetical protein